MSPVSGAQLHYELGQPNGWFAQAAMDAFGFLESEYGYALDRVDLHYRGFMVWYRSTAYLVSIEYDPGTHARNVVAFVAEDLRPGGQPPRVFSIPRVLQERAPTGAWIAPIDPARPIPQQVHEILGRWASGVRGHIPELASGVLMPVERDWREGEPR